MFKPIVFIVALIAALPLAKKSRTDAFNHQLAMQRYEDVYYLPDADWLLLGSTGYREAGANLLWLKSLVYYSDELVHHGVGINLGSYTNAILRLDPLFKRVYTWGSTVNLYKAHAATLEEIQFSAKLLERARALFPDDGEIAWQLGALYLHEMSPRQDDTPVQEATLSKGRELIRIASLLGGGPPWGALNSAARLAKLGKTEHARRHLLEVYETIDDDFAKRQLELRLQELQSESFVLALRATVAEFRKQHAAAFPYTDGGLYYLLGTPSPRRAMADAVISIFDPVRHLASTGTHPSFVNP